MRTAGRSLMAVLSGYVTMAILIMLFSAAVKWLSPAWFAVEGAPSRPYLALNLTYSFVAAVCGGYVAAWIAGRRPLQHAIVLGGCVLVMSIISAVQYADRQPRWYQIVLGVSMPLAVVLGGRLQGAWFPTLAK